MTYSPPTLLAMPEWGQHIHHLIRAFIPLPIKSLYMPLSEPMLHFSLGQPMRIFSYVVEGRVGSMIAHLTYLTPDKQHLYPTTAASFTLL